METPDILVKKARPFFLNFLGKLGTDLNTLTAAPVTVNLTSVELMRGMDDIEALLEKDRCVAYVREDGLDTGDVHLIIDVATSIALTGLMMMMGEGVIQNQVKTREYNEEIQEGFNEVANQIVGGFNDLVEKKMPNGGHLFLESTDRFDYGNNPPTLKETTTYLSIVAEMQVSSFPPEDCRILLSKGFAEALLTVEIEGSAEEEAENAAKKTANAAAAEESSEDVADDFSEALGQEEGDADGGDGSELTGTGGALEGAGGPTNYSSDDGLPVPDEPGSISVVMTEKSFALKEGEPVMNAINAMRHDGYRFIGVENNGGKLIQVLSHSDIRQIMGPFFGTKAMGPRGKAVCTLPLGKFNEDQQLIRIPQSGSINQAADLLAEFNLRAIPVVGDDEVLKGFIPIHSVMSYFRKKKNS
jgi:CBS domain-containing protein